MSEVQKIPGNPLPSSEKELGSRLSAVIDAVGSRQKASEIAGRSTDQLLKYVKGTAEPPFMALAKLCMATGRSLEWLATGVEPAKPLQDKASAPSQSLQLENVKIAAQLLQEELDTAGLTLPPAAYGEAVAILVQLLEKGLAEAEVIPLAQGVVRTATGGRNER